VCVVLVDFGERHRHTDKRAALHRSRPPADRSGGKLNGKVTGHARHARLVTDILARMSRGCNAENGHAWNSSLTAHYDDDGVADSLRCSTPVVFGRGSKRGSSRAGRVKFKAKTKDVRLGGRTDGRTDGRRRGLAAAVHRMMPSVSQSSNLIARDSRPTTCTRPICRPGISISSRTTSLTDEGLRDVSGKRNHCRHTEGRLAVSGFLVAPLARCEARLK